MHIIGGEFKRRNLYYGKDKELRPTKNKVREAIFDILQNEISSAFVVDLFCGTGALGLEALSRGASYVEFVDKDTDLIRKNMEIFEKLIPHEKYKIRTRDVLKFLRQTEHKFDVIFLDPPWSKPALFELTLNAIRDFAILNCEGVIVCEHPRKIKIDFDPGQTKQYKYGETVLSVIKL